MRLFKLQIMVWVLSLISLNLISQDLITDRPDQTESSSLVPKGHLQWESGFWIGSDVNITKTITTGLNSSLFRIGLTDNLEFRLGTDLIRKTDYLDRMGLWEFRERSTYLESIYAGGKIKLTEQDDFIPEMAILGHVSFPRPFSESLPGEYIAPDITFAASYGLNDRMGVGINLGSHWPGFGKGKPDIFYSVVLGLAHSERLSSFWEIYGYNLAHTIEPDVRADIGLTYLLKPNFQLDLSTGTGFSPISPDFFLSFGFSWRLPD